MIFTNPRATIRSNQHQLNAIQQQQQHTNMKPLLLFTNQRKFVPLMRSIHKPSNVSVVHAKTFEQQVSAIQNGKKIRWGEPFWNFFHILAEKVREDEFQTIRKGLLDMIYIICSNLPCPDCTQHAITYLNGINFNKIQTKDQFKYMLYNFHNAVNVRKGYPIYPRENLDEKYQCGILQAAFQEFMRHFTSKTHNFRLLSDQMQRSRLSKKIYEWFFKNGFAFHTN
jgi:hypothetical protein